MRGARPQKLKWLDKVLKSELDTIQWLMGLSLLMSHRRCSKCKKSMSLIRCRRSIDKCLWYVYILVIIVFERYNYIVTSYNSLFMPCRYCSRCKKQCNIRKGSIFTRFPRLPLAVIMQYFKCWADNYNCKHCKDGKLLITLVVLSAIWLMIVFVCYCNLVLSWNFES